MKEIYNKAIKSYNKLKDIVDNYNGTLEELCDELGGHNLEDDLFDINYDWICATVYSENNKLILGKNIELWNDETYEFVGNFDIDELLKE